MGQMTNYLRNGRDQTPIPSYPSYTKSPKQLIIRSYSKLFYQDRRFNHDDNDRTQLDRDDSDRKRLLYFRTGMHYRSWSIGLPAWGLPGLWSTQSRGQILPQRLQCNKLLVDAVTPQGNRVGSGRWSMHMGGHAIAKFWDLPKARAFTKLLTRATNP